MNEAHEQVNSHKYALPQALLALHLHISEADTQMNIASVATRGYLSLEFPTRNILLPTQPLPFLDIKHPSSFTMMSTLRTRISEAGTAMNTTSASTRGYLSRDSSPEILLPYTTTSILGHETSFSLHNNTHP